MCAGAAKSCHGRPSHMRDRRRGRRRGEQERGDDDEHGPDFCPHTRSTGTGTHPCMHARACMCLHTTRNTHVFRVFILLPRCPSCARAHPPSPPLALVLALVRALATRHAARRSAPGVPYRRGAAGDARARLVKGARSRKGRRPIHADWCVQSSPCFSIRLSSYFFVLSTFLPFSRLRFGPAFRSSMVSPNVLRLRAVVAPRGGGANDSDTPARKMRAGKNRSRYAIRAQ